MISIKDLKKLRKDEMVIYYARLISEYKELEEKYEELEQRYEDLDDCYAELENGNANKEDDEEESDEYKALDKLLHELKFNTDLQERIQEYLFKVYKQEFIDILRLYCVDIPEEIYNMQIPKTNGINEKIYDLFEDYAEEALRFKIYE